MNYGIKGSREYMDWSAAVEDDPLNVVAVDQEKFNLTYLVFPEVEGQGLSVLPRDYVKDLHEFMDKQTRQQLTLPPLTFMRYWQGLHNDPRMKLNITQNMPEDYMSRMVIQSHKVQARLVVREGNVVSPTFWKAA